MILWLFTKTLLCYKITFYWLFFTFKYLRERCAFFSINAWFNASSELLPGCVFMIWLSVWHWQRNHQTLLLSCHIKYINTQHRKSEECSVGSKVRYYLLNFLTQKRQGPILLLTSFPWELPICCAEHFQTWPQVIPTLKCNIVHNG